MSNTTPLSLMFISADPDKIHMGLMVAATAAASGRPTELFFTKKAAMAVTTDGFDTLMKNADGSDTQSRHQKQEEKGIADFSILMDALASLNATFTVCETALAEFDITPDRLMTRPAVYIGGIASFLEAGAGGDFMTF